MKIFVALIFLVIHALEFGHGNLDDIDDFDEQLIEAEERAVSCKTEYKPEDPSAPKPPKKCCKKHNTGLCKKGHLGKCVPLWQEPIDCEYTMNGICKYPFCTCCASCTGGQDNTCENRGNNCRRCCEDDEYDVTTLKCPNGACKCCRSCVKDSCANGEGECRLKSQGCPQNTTVSPNSICKSDSCQCCIPSTTHCEDTCANGMGVCTEKHDECPLHHIQSVKYTCKDPEKCKCCIPDCHESFCAEKMGYCTHFSKRCTENTFESQAPCDKSGLECKCCERCPDSCADGIGKCYKKDQGCPEGHIIINSQECKHESCICCIPKCHNTTCAQSMGICKVLSEQCPNGGIESVSHTCESDSCKCCIRDCPEITCHNDQGYCTHMSKDCAEGTYHSEEQCKGPECKCCEKCPDHTCCASSGGICVASNAICPARYPIDHKCPLCGDVCKCCLPDNVPLPGDCTELLQKCGENLG